MYNRFNKARNTMNSYRDQLDKLVKEAKDDELVKWVEISTTNILRENELLTLIINELKTRKCQNSSKA